MTKKELRSLMLDQRKAMSMDEKIRQSSIIVDCIRQDQRYQHASVIALFYPMKDEVNLLSLLKDDKKFLFPRVEKDGIHFYLYHKNMVWETSNFGVREPHKSEFDYTDHIDLMLTPALAISHDLYRIGYGKGFYDRFLQTNRPHHVIGVIYDFQYVSYVEHDDYDQQLDDVITG